MVAAKPLTKCDSLPRRPAVTSAQAALALEAAHKIPTTSPSFVKAISGSHLSGLWFQFPAQWAEDNMPGEDMTITLVDMERNEWRAIWLAMKSGMVGWRKFVVDHELEEDDVLVFERMDDHERGYVRGSVLKVHICRALPANPKELKR